MKKKIIGILVVTLLIAAATLPVVGINDVENEKKNYSDNALYETNNFDSPDDFHLTIVCGGFGPWTELYFLKINPNGEAFYNIMYLVNRSTANWTLISQFNLTENELNDIWNTIIENDFFDLNNCYSKGTVMGGTFANISLTAEGNEYSVQTENIDICQFDNIVKKINSLTPGNHDLSYNALINSPPLRPSSPDGPSNVSKGKEYAYKTSTFDFDGDQIYFCFDWGDETMSDWFGPYQNQQEATITHTWNKKGNYDMRVKAIDDPNGDGNYSDGYESGWSDPLSITAPKGKHISSFLIPLLLKRLIKMFPFLDCLFDYSDASNSPLKTQGQSVMQGSTGTEVVPDPNDDCKFTIVIRICLVGSWIDKADDNTINKLHGRIEQEIESRWNRDEWDKTGPEGKPDGKPDGEPPWRVPCAFWCDIWEPGCVIHFDVKVTKVRNCSQQYKETLLNGGYHVINVNDPPPDVSTVDGLDDDGDGKTDDLPDPGENFNGKGSTTGNWDHNAAPGVYAHECGHLLGLFDQYTVSWPDKNHNNKKDPEERETKPKDNYKGNIMAETNGYPSQDDIDDIWKNSCAVCPCKCCPEEEDEEEPENNIQTPQDGSQVSSPLIVGGYADDGLDGSGVALLDYLLEWDGGSHDGGELVIDPPDNHVDYGLGPINLGNYIEPGDWIKITTYATDAAGNTGEDSVTVTWVEEEEDTIPPITEKTIGEPQWEEGYTIASFTPIWLEATDPEPSSGVNYIHYEVWQGGILMGSEDIPGDTVEMTFGMYGVIYGIAELRWYAVDNAENVEDMHYQEHFILY